MCQFFEIYGIVGERNCGNTSEVLPCDLFFYERIVIELRYGEFRFGNQIM